MPEIKGKTWKDSLKTRKYEEHKHCIVCGRAVPQTQDFCSQECKDGYKKADKSKSKKNTISIVVMVVMVIAILIVSRLLGMS